MPNIGRPFSDMSVSNTVETMAASPHVIMRLTCWHTNAADAFLQLFDAADASDVTLGTTVPTDVFPLVAGNGTLIGASEIPIPGDGVLYRNGIQYAVTTTETGNTAPASAAKVSAVIKAHGG